MELKKIISNTEQQASPRGDEAMRWGNGLEAEGLPATLSYFHSHESLGKGSPGSSNLLCKGPEAGKNMA